jgi:hypothetical protein
MTAIITYSEQITLIATGYWPSFGEGPDPYGPGKGVWLLGANQADLGDGSVISSPPWFPTFMGTDLTGAQFGIQDFNFRVLSNTFTVTPLQWGASYTWSGFGVASLDNVTSIEPFQLVDTPNGFTGVTYLSLDTWTPNAPLTVLVPTASASFTEEGGAVPLAPSLSISDQNSVNLTGATVSITGGTFLGDGDVLATITTGTNITASYDSGTETLSLTGSDSLANYVQVLDAVTFTAGENPTNYGSNPTRTVTWTVSDASNNTASATSTVSVTAVNDPPVLSGLTNASFNRGSEPVVLASNLTVSDPDDLDLAGATVQITGGTFTNDGDVLNALTTNTSITASYDSSTETLTLTGPDTLAHYQQVLESVTFTSSRPNRTHSGMDLTRTVTWTVNDGQASNNTASATSTVSIIDRRRHHGRSERDPPLGLPIPGSNSPGTLAVSDGTQIAHIGLLRNYSLADFTLGSDGHGGTSVVDPPLSPLPLAAQADSPSPGLLNQYLAAFAPRSGDESNLAGYGGRSSFADPVVLLSPREAGA